MHQIFALRRRGACGVRVGNSHGVSLKCIGNPAKILLLVGAAHPASYGSA